MHNRNTYLGIEIGGTKLQLVLESFDGQTLQRKRWPVHKSEGAPGILRQIESTLREWEVQPLATGIGFGGPVDWQTGLVAASHQIAGWSGINLAEWVGQLTGTPVFVDNDANVAALGEAFAGAGRDQNPILYVTLGSGVGGGLISNGQIYHGCPPGEVEVGHLRLDQQGNTLESRCSGWALDQRIREAIRREPDSILAQLVGSTQTGEARFLRTAVENGDPLAVNLLREVTRDLAFGLSHAVHLLHPEIIILGGGLSLMGEPLRKGVADQLPAFLMKAFQPGPSVALAQLGEDAVPKGAILLARKYYIFEV